MGGKLRQGAVFCQVLCSAKGYRLSAIGYRLSAIGYWLLGGASPVSQSPYELEAGPSVIYRSDLDVNQSGGKGNFAYRVFRHIRGHTGCFFGPRNPERPVRLERLEKDAHLRLKETTAARKEMNNRKFASN